ncbi:nucleolar MIF4G domain-containing protein 1-like isoform X2 [Chenopodium quinoa]|uniref:nucleolar MIF4G domain-containing protein 1-like isoform X2 n=1 Tax=Chenopodium quinoa TaxID=63459 RepID=UPI000B7751DE|nr:nucleolar MIF4G domain-containing protein 1-like isoform X2 [Chenopodium quinoa]
MERMASRKEKRKAARQEKKQHKHQSLLQHQIFSKSKRNSNNLRNGSVKEGMISSVENVSTEGKNRKLSMMESDSDGGNAKPAVKSRMSKYQKKVGKKRTGFEEFLEMDMKSGPSMEEDLEMERKLAKRLKLKNGKLDDGGDGLDFLFEGIPSFHDSSEKVYDRQDDSETESLLEDDDRNRKKKRKKMKKSGRESNLFASGDGDEANDSSETEIVGRIEKKKSKRRKSKRRNVEQESVSDDGDDATDMKQAENMSLDSDEEGEETTVLETDSGLQSIGKYVAPHLRSRSGDDLQEYVQIRRRVRGLLNRMSESNVESITGEIFSIFQSVSRAIASQIVSEEVLASCAGGPRGNEQYAAVFAAFLAGMSSMIGIDFGARFMASLAKSFEDEYSKEDNLSLRNLSLLLSYLCIFGVCSSDLIYDFLIKLSKQLAEIDVSIILTILQCCGMKLRGDDPTSMKDFISSVQSRVNELKATSGDAEMVTYSKRMEFMLETICDIKNNKKRAKEDSSPHTRIKKWLQKLRVDDITLRGVKWSKLLDPNKKGQWWFSGDLSSQTENVRKVSGKMDKEVNEAQKMLNLAAKQRMNTDTRRAIFLVIMSGEDYIDAFEQLLSLNLHGKQDREIMRVLVECCLQEKSFNKYYTALASKLCSHDKNHKFTLQSWSPCL